MKKEDIIAQLKKEGVNSLDQLADLLVKKAHKNGDPNQPMVNSVIIYSHGFVTS